MMLSQDASKKEKQVPGQKSTLGQAVVTRKKVPLTGRNLQQNQTRRKRTSGNAWEGEEERREMARGGEREETGGQRERWAEAAGSRQGRERLPRPEDGSQRSSDMSGRCCKKMEHESSGEEWGG